MSEYPKAMHGPDDGYAVVHHIEAESALRKEGWVDGHEHFTAKAAGLPSVADLDNVEAEKQVAEATKKERKPRNRKPKQEATADAQV